MFWLGCLGQLSWLFHNYFHKPFKKFRSINFELLTLEPTEVAIKHKIILRYFAVKFSLFHILYYEFKFVLAIHCLLQSGKLKYSAKYIYNMYMPGAFSSHRRFTSQNTISPYTFTTRITFIVVSLSSKNIFFWNVNIDWYANNSKFHSLL